MAHKKLEAEVCPCEGVILICDEQTNQHSGGSIKPESESKALVQEWLQIHLMGTTFNSWLMTWVGARTLETCHHPDNACPVHPHLMGLAQCVACHSQDIRGRAFLPRCSNTCAFWMVLSVPERVWKGSVGKALPWLEWNFNVFCMQPNPFRWLLSSILRDNSGSE